MDSLLNIFITLFIVVDPIGLAPMFVGLTPGAAVAQRKRMAITGTLLAGLILLTFFFSGAALLGVLGIGIPAFRIAGGILLFLLAIDMVFARQSGLRSTTSAEQLEAAHKADVSVFPLAFPLIAGPGALTTVILMTSTDAETVVFAGMLGVLLLVIAMTMVSLLLASRITALLGETGSNVVSRVLGLILAALAVQYVIDGVRASLST